VPSSNSSARSSSKEGTPTPTFVRIAAITFVTAVAGSCLNTADPGRFIFQYAIAAYGCGTDCSAAGPTPISTAARGDTVWLRHDIVLLQASDTVRRATIRPDCALNVVIESPTAPIDTLPKPTCSDSLASHNFVLGATLTRFTRWVVDSSLAPATYDIVGRVLVQPRIEPRFLFAIT